MLTFEDPEDWTVDELRRWLRVVRFMPFSMLHTHSDRDFREASCLAKGHLAMNWSNE